MINYPKATEIQQSIFIGTWDDKIPVYHVPSMHALNQLIGYMKHINSLNGTVLYRGQCELYRTVSPCILRDSELKDKNSGQLEKVIDAFLKDKDIMKLLGFRKSQLNGWLLYEKCIVEAVLQHYGAKTFCVDFVDNHWTALWFGLYRWDSDNNKYVERDIWEQDTGTEYIKRDIESQKKTLPKQPDPNSVTLTKNYIQELTQIAASTQFKTTSELVVCTYPKRVCCRRTRQRVSKFGNASLSRAAAMSRLSFFCLIYSLYP